MPDSPRARSQSRTRGAGRSVVTAAGGGGGGGTDYPTTLTGKIVWLRGSDLGSNGSTITTWTGADSTGSGTSAGTGTDVTVVTAATPSSGKVARFAAAKYLTLGGTFTATATEAWIVCKGASTSTKGLWAFGSGDSFPQNFPFSGDGNVYESFGRSGTRIAFTPSLALNAWRLYRVRADASSWKAWLDNTLQTQSGTNTVGWDSTRILGAGRRSTGFDSQYDGDVAELLVFNRVLTDDEASALTTYLNTQHGITAGAVQRTGFTASASTSNGGWTPDQANDSNTGTQWLSNNEVSGAWLKMTASGAVQVSAYKVGCTLSGQEARAPKTWKLQGSSDDSAWTDLDTQTNAASWTAGTLRTYTLSSPQTYRYWRLLFTSSQSDAAFVGTSEFQLYA